MNRDIEGRPIYEGDKVCIQTMNIIFITTVFKSIPCARANFITRGHSLYSEGYIVIADGRIFGIKSVLVLESHEQEGSE